MKPNNNFDDTIRLKAMIVVGTEWSRTFSEAAYQGEDSLNAINSFGLSVVSDGIVKSGKITSDMKAVPIRLCDEGEERNLGIDWCQNRSPIDAIHCGVIPRWFPWDWIYNDGTVLPGFIDIDLGEMPTTGEHIVLACEVTKIASDMKNFFFCNIISDEDLKKYETRMLDHEIKSGSERGARDMFKKNKHTEDDSTPVETNETVATTESVAETIVIDEKLNNDEQINVEKDTGDINVVETSESKNNINGGSNMSSEEKEINTKPHQISEKAKKALKPTLIFLGGSAFGAALTLTLVKVFGGKDAACETAEVAEQA